MSAADAPGRAALATAAPAPRRLSTRLFRSELWLIFGRRRNWAGFLVLAGVPVVMAIAARASTPEAGDGPQFLSQITENGMFVALAALVVELPLFLPLAVGAISGDAIAGEANLGTLRYVLAVPVIRTRLVLVKYAAIVVFSDAAVLVVAGTGTVMGLALFGGGPMTTLSGTQIPFAAGVGRLALVCLYITACIAALGAIGLFVSTLTEQPVGATIAIVMLAIASQILDNIPQLHAIHEYLPTHYWMAFGDLLRDPMATGLVGTGLFSAAGYTAVFVAAAWARFAGRDISS